ncbi:MAG: MBL fold metallo-hydrolase [Acutalibacteraceae bacterium]|nr:MBL fold metallo-hydrolase [Clostridiales bacterium]
MARYCPLFSGSSGNCTYIGTAEGGILVDAGVSAKRIETALRERDIEPHSIEAVFVTHEHIDHISGLRLLTKRYGWRVYASCGTLEAIADTRPLEPQTVCEVIEETGVCAAGMEIQPFATSHDSRESLGFRITLPGGRRVAVATDTGVMTDTVRAALSGCDLVHIESNHDVRMLENGPYPYYLKRRILADTGHLSNDACAAELTALAQNGTTRFVLAHLSRENNLPEIAYMTAQAALCGAGMQENIDFLLQVAPRGAEAPVTLF